ncbi:MAG TPA: hypothetical protein VGG39_15750 [Polyangiaceae bacterium]|jgi:hypothetical protein
MRRVKLPGAGHRDILYGEAPFGWRLNPDRSGLVPDPEEQRLLSVVRHLYLAERLPMRGVAERLRKMGVVNRRGRPFGLSGIWEMIHRRQERPVEAKPSARKARRKSIEKAGRRAAHT